MDRGAWWAIIHEVAKSRTRLSANTHTSANSKRSPFELMHSQPWGTCWKVETGTASPKSHLVGPSLVVQWLRLLTSTAGGVGSILGWEAKIPHALWYVKKKERKKRR